MADLAKQVADLQQQVKTMEAILDRFKKDLEYRLTNISAHDAWQDSEADNVASGYPLVLKLYVPEGNDTRGIQKVLLSIWLEAFRSYGTAAASADLGTLSVSTNTTLNASATTTGPSATTTTSQSSSTTTGPSATTTTSQSSSTTTSETAHYHADESDTAGPIGDLASHTHATPIHNTYTSGAHAHGMAHTHEIPSHTHALSHTHEIPSHTHSLSHTHGMDHSHLIGSHSHGLVHGIYVGGTPSGCTIIINGADKTSALTGAASFGTDQLNLDVTQYIAKGLNTIQITSATLGRIRAMFYASLYLNMGR